MQDRELYRQILGIESPWKVERVELRRADGEVHVFVEHDEPVRTESGNELRLHTPHCEQCFTRQRRPMASHSLPKAYWQVFRTRMMAT